MNGKKENQRMKRFVVNADFTKIAGAMLALAGLLICAAIVTASDGWTQRGSYFYFSGGNDAYVQTPGYYYCGRWYPATYTFSHVSTPPKLKLPTYSENWRSEAVAFVRAKQDRAEFAAFMNAAGYPMSSMADSSYQLGAATGSTGYTYQNSATFYGDSALNLSAQFQSLARLAENSQAGTKQITSDFADLLGQASDGSKQVAEILARGQVLAALARSLDGNKATIQEKSTSFQNGTLPMPTPSGKLWEASASKCLKCHQGPGAEGRFDVTQYRLLDAATKMKVVQRLLLPADDTRHMPKGGPSMTPAEVALWLSPS
jgi:hypothetical protein